MRDGFGNRLRFARIAGKSADVALAVSLLESVITIAVPAMLADPDRGRPPILAWIAEQVGRPIIIAEPFRAATGNTGLVDSVQHSMATLDGGDDVLRISVPDEGPRALVVLLDEVLDGGLQGDDGMEDASFRLAAGRLGEKTLDGVEPGSRGRGEMEGPARKVGEPALSPRGVCGWFLSSTCCRRLLRRAGSMAC